MVNTLLLLATSIIMLSTWHKKINQSKLDAILDLAYPPNPEKPTYPQRSKVFNAFEKCSFTDTKVVILGQDPYHKPNQAHGLCFSVPDGEKIPPSLKNIHKCLNEDLGNTIPNSGNLESWAKQGVLLLNSVLTVQEKTPESHSKIGWQEITDDIMSILSTEKDNLVFMLWGNYAKKKQSILLTNNHLILTSVHPSPLSAHRGFLKNKHFSQCNKYLEDNGIKPINW